MEEFHYLNGYGYGALGVKANELGRLPIACAITIEASDRLDLVEVAPDETNRSNFETASHFLKLPFHDDQGSCRRLPRRRRDACRHDGVVRAGLLRAEFVCWKARSRAHCSPRCSVA